MSAQKNTIKKQKTHQAKGGEWDNVYVIGCNAKMFPHKSGEPLEEARIYFVAISRAKTAVTVTGGPAGDCAGVGTIG